MYHCVTPIYDVSCSETHVSPTRPTQGCRKYLFHVGGAPPKRDEEPSAHQQGTDRDSKQFRKATKAKAISTRDRLWYGLSRRIFCNDYAQRDISAKRVRACIGTQRRISWKNWLERAGSLGDARRCRKLLQKRAQSCPNRCFTTSRDLACFRAKEIRTDLRVQHDAHIALVAQTLDTSRPHIHNSCLRCLW